MYCLSTPIVHMLTTGLLGALTGMSLYLVYQYRTRVCAKCKQPFFIKDLHKGVMDYYCGGCTKPTSLIKFWAGFILFVGAGLWLGIDIRSIIP